MILDLDHFKNINDTLGHGTGDELIDLARRRAARPASTRACAIARLGGDELAVLLPTATPDEVGAAAESVLEAVRAQRVASPSGRLRRSARASASPGSTRPG